MRKFTRAVVAAAVAMASGSAQAGPVGEYASGAAGKVAHGLAELAYSPVEILVTPVAFAIDREREGAFAALVGFAWGLPMGALNAGYRGAHGGAEVLTFPFLADAGRARPFDVTPKLTGWTMIPADPRSAAPVRTAAAHRPSGD